MKKSSQIQCVGATALPERVSVAMTEIAENMQEGLLQLNKPRRPGQLPATSTTRWRPPLLRSSTGDAQRLKEGHIVLGGSFTRPIDIADGDVIHADYGPLGAIGVSFLRD